MTQEKIISGQNVLWQRPNCPRPNRPTYKCHLFAKFKCPYDAREKSPRSKWFMIKDPMIYDKDPIVPGPIVLHINITYLLSLNVPMTQEKILSGQNDLWQRPNCPRPNRPTYKCHLYAKLKCPYDARENSLRSKWFMAKDPIVPDPPKKGILDHIFMTKAQLSYI